MSSWASAHSICGLVALTKIDKSQGVEPRLFETLSLKCENVLKFFMPLALTCG